MHVNENYKHNAPNKHGNSNNNRVSVFWTTLYIRRGMPYLAMVKNSFNPILDANAELDHH